MDEDLEIVKRVKGGDSHAFSLLVGKYKKPILNLIYRYTGRADQAEDLAQEVFLRAFKGLSGFKAEAKFFTWLYRIAVNLCLRTRERNSKFLFQSLEEKSQDGSLGKTLISDVEPHQEMERSELRNHVQEAVMALPPDQRSVVILYRYHDLSYEEIAETLNISLAAVKSRLHRARTTLKERLSPYVIGEAG